jgi:4-amino-4-deoxy-L-arabinose transferase-like glycosyltransferase
MVVANLITLFLLYRYARALVRRDLAFLAVALYATSFPATYYQSRVAPEPLTNLFFLATLVALLRSARPGTGDRARLAWAALAGVAAVSAVLCKLMLMAAWPVYAAGWILAAPNANLRLRPRLRSIAAYALGVIAASAAYAPFTDWQAFADGWSPGRHASTDTLIGERLAGALQYLVAALWNMPALNLVPELTQSNAFFFFEFLFLLAAGAGVCLSLARPFPARRLLVFALGYCTFTLVVWFYRAGGQDFSGFHYLFPLMLLLAPAAAVSADALLPMLREASLSRVQRALLLALVVVIVHHGALFGAFNSSSNDALAYQQTGGTLASPVLERLRPGERLAVFGKPSTVVHGVMDNSFGRPGCHSPLATELRDLIREARPPLDAATRESLAASGVVYVLDLSGTEPRGETLDEWWSRERRARGLPATGTEPPGP